MKEAPVRGRRTQEQRRAATRGALLRATVACLVERGYRGTTTLEIEKRAGVSRGARIHHFATKAELLAAAVDHLYGRLSDHYEQAFGSADVQRSDAERMRAGLRLLWGVYRQSDYAAVLELMMAARTDPELRGQLAAVGHRHRELALQAAARYFPELSGDTAAELVEVFNSTLLGLLVQRNVEVSAERERAALSMIEGLAVQRLS